ncbi:MAG: glycoside hydrolase family 9 protein, partial [Desulfobacteraceae bacterium]
HEAEPEEETSSSGDVSDDNAELLKGGDFNGTMGAWWTSETITPSAADGELEATITAGGVNAWDALVGQHNIPVFAGSAYSLTLDARASQSSTITVLLQQNGGSYTQYFNAPLDLTTEMQTFEFTFTAAEDNQAASFQFQMGGQGEFTVYLDNISLMGQAPEPEEDNSSTVRLNQTGYYPQAPKRASIANSSETPLEWRLYDNTDSIVATGGTVVFGQDAASQDNVHLADFSSFATEGIGYTLEVDGVRSHAFDIKKDLYSQLRLDALAYFYHNRSGIELTMPYVVDEIWARPAGHIGVAPNQGDTDVACFDQTDKDDVAYEGCNYTLDVSGGWYDAGDHGKYVVNGGISVWTMLNQYERALSHGINHFSMAAYADGKMNIPENENGVPDILDEARWGLEFLIAMQVPQGGMVEGVLREGMVHHKMHDEAWTGLGLRPNQDEQMRYLYPPSTAATLNMAATAAQGARIYKTIDAEFAAKCLSAAEKAWDAAVANPDVFAKDNFDGGGPYGDADVSDEFYWAAAELFITTGAEKYHNAMASSEHYLKLEFEANADGVIAGSSIAWPQTAALGTISLAMVPNSLSQTDIGQARAEITALAEGYVAAVDASGYELPYYSPDYYPWGSNSSVLNNMLIIAYAYEFTSDIKYLNAISMGMDYILGRNPMDQSYVSGYGTRKLLHPHHRFWADQLDPTFPGPPPGAVSGGPNSGLEDPYAQIIFPDGCPPQKCFVDHIESWSTNEITINWNAPFAWVAAFLDDYLPHLSDELDPGLDDNSSDQDVPDCGVFFPDDPGCGES